MARVDGRCMINTVANICMNSVAVFRLSDTSNEPCTSTFTLWGVMILT